MGRRRAALEGPAERLAQSLRADGKVGPAARLSEFIPDGDIGGDDHTALLAECLAGLAWNEQLAADQRAEAARLAAIAGDLPSGIGRAGAVWIVWVEQSERARSFGAPAEPSYYSGSWQADEDGDHDLYQDGPAFETLAAAMEWAKHRSDRIIVRPEWDPGTCYSAGRAATGHDFAPLIQPDT